MESFATETGGTPEPRPFFEDPESNITVQLGAQVYMHCRVQNLQDTLKVNSHFSSFSRHFFPLIPHSPELHHLYNLAMYSERRFLGRFSKNLKKKKKETTLSAIFQAIFSLSCTLFKTYVLSKNLSFCREIFLFSFVIKQDSLLLIFISEVKYHNSITAVGKIPFPVSLTIHSRDN